METMTRTHTPGPWTVIPTTTEVFTPENRIRIVQTTNSPNWHEAQAEMRANARLIAAAPELLEALKRAVEVLDAEGIVYGNCDDEPLDVLSAAREAIEKAEAK